MAYDIPSQKPGDMPVAFILTDRNTITELVQLNIRPEDMTRNDTSRTTIHQTFSTPWADDFGPGVRTIQISGHTGWRGSETENSVELFTRLHENVFRRWHQYRAEALLNGKSPDSVSLIFSDGLHGEVSTVIPTHFNLKRNKARPLLLQYQIGMSVVLDGVDQGAADASFGAARAIRVSGEAGDAMLTGDVLRTASASLDASIKTIVDTNAKIGPAIDKAIGAPVADFTQKTADILQKVQKDGLLGAIGMGGGLNVETMLKSNLAPLFDIGKNLSRAAANIYKTVYHVLDASNRMLNDIGKMVSQFRNAWCILEKIADLFKKKWLDWSKLYGSSTCSVTAGGRPLSPLRDQNPFMAMAPANADKTGLSVDQKAAGAIKNATEIDTVLKPISQTGLVAMVDAISGGLVVA